MDAANGLTAATAVAGAVMAGVYLGFDTIVMPGLRRQPASAAVRSMQAINRAAVRPGFMLWFFGSAVLAVVALVVELLSGAGGAATIVRVLGDALVAVGFLVTVVVNVPRNAAVDGLDPDADATPARWRTLERGWVAGNRVRGLAALAGAVLLAASLVD